MLTLDEIKELFNLSDKHMRDEDWKKLIKEIDENRAGKVISYASSNGKISYDSDRVPRV